MRTIVPVVLSGGAGTRLWPLSREAAPKPFMPLPDGETLLGKTAHRAVAVPGSRGLVTVTNRDYYFRTKDVIIEATPGHDIDVDGEILAETPAHFTLLPQALKVMAPLSFEDKKSLSGSKAIART